MNASTVVSAKTPKTKRPEEKMHYQLSSTIRKTPFLLDKRNKFTIGKMTKNNAVVKEGTISDIHASIKWVKSAFTIKDEKSTNGTYVNGKRIEKATPLKDGDKIKIGKYVFTLTILKVRSKTDEKNNKKVITKKVKVSNSVKGKKSAVKKTAEKKSAVKKPAPKKAAAKKPAVKKSAVKKTAPKKAAKKKIATRTMI